MALPDVSALNRLLDGGPFAMKGLYHATGELTGALVLTVQYPNILKIDAGGAERAVTLPAAADSHGMWFLIVNASSGAENLVVNTDLVTINQNDAAFIYNDAGTWVHGFNFVTAQS